MRGWTVTLKVRYADFRQITHSRPIAKLIQSQSIIEGVSVELLSVLFPLGNGVRLLRVTLSSLSTEAQAGAPQLTLALQGEGHDKSRSAHGR